MSDSELELGQEEIVEEVEQEVEVPSSASTASSEESLSPEARETMQEIRGMMNGSTGRVGACEPLPKSLVALVLIWLSWKRT